MSTSPTAGTLSTLGLTGGPSSSTQQLPGNLNADKEMFLKLLSAQLQSQDPLDPMDNNEFVQQMTQFSMVEQLTQMNTQFASILDIQEFMQARELIGTDVTYTDDNNEAQTGAVEGVSLTDGGVSLMVNGGTVGLSQVLGFTAADKD